MKKCWDFLDLTSRSFAAVIKELEGDLSRVVSVAVQQSGQARSSSRRAPLHPQVALFYLILRGLDTIEDDMSLSIETKAPLLENFNLKLEEDGWNFKECAFVLALLRCFGPPVQS